MTVRAWLGSAMLGAAIFAAAPCLAQGEDSGEAGNGPGRSRAEAPPAMLEAWARGDYGRALAGAEAALAVCTPPAARPDFCLDLVLSASSLSFWAGDAVRAEAHGRRALAIATASLGEDHRDTARSYNNLGAALRGQGRLPEAESLQRRALEISLRTAGENDRATASYYHNLGSLAADRGRAAEAESLIGAVRSSRLQAKPIHRPRGA